MAEFVDLYLAGGYMQRPANDSVIWTAEEQPAEFLVGDAEQRLELLGGRAQPGNEVLVYQQHTTGSSGTSALMAYDFATDESRAIAETGDETRSTQFSLISGDHAIARFVDRDVHGIVILNLDEDRNTDVFDPDRAVCRSDRDETCPRYDHATFHRESDLILGVRPIDGASYGFFWYHYRNGTEELLAAIPRNGDLWHVENLYEFTVSLQDRGGRPIPGLSLSPDEPLATFPATGFPRPQQLS